MTELLDFSLPAGGFAGPLALWLACHQRLAGVCGLLQRLPAHLDDFGADDAARGTAEGVRRYFNIAAPRHEDDEDIDLFPRLVGNLSGRRRATIRSLIDRLQDDHRAAAALWQPLDEWLADVQHGVKPRLDDKTISAFVERYLSHRDAEERTLLDVMRRTLRPDDLDAVGEAMASRRGLTWSKLNSGRL
jgi:pyridoxamine 5'-phosphate oxidase